MNELFELWMTFIVLSVISIPICLITYVEIKKKRFNGILLTPIFLLCLIALTLTVSQLMIDNTTLLQVNGTVIAGLLVLLSINSIWVSSLKEPLKPKVTKIKKYGIYFTPSQLLILFIPFSASSIFAIFDSEEGILRFFSVGFCIIGFILIIIVVCLLVLSERRQDLDFSDMS